MLERIEGKVAWVTGAGTGIGQAGAIALASQGVKIVLSGRRRAPLEETAALISQKGLEVLIEPLDVKDEASVYAVRDRIVDQYGRIDILVNNAGTNVTERHWDVVTGERWREVIDIDLSGAFYCARAVLPVMRERRDGLIINISSWAGRFYSYITGPAYSAAKHGLLALNASINMEECVNGIRACAICPGEVWTPIIDRRPDALPQEEKEKMLKAEDVGEAILFVARLPKHVCINEMLISPTWNRSYVNDPARRRV
ncbi:MAG TPA: SDR family oxidoreductase [Syntrophales bacterium]|nr:SDR family oxidoreductase [Syntrophales bacterium]HOL58373.1 SDR family oxidoreductase [Syntrophales bacterium]HPO34542.1 SDR family oxidoreductase [Syntrophales bacterium]